MEAIWKEMSGQHGGQGSHRSRQVSGGTVNLISLLQGEQLNACENHQMVGN